MANAATTSFLQKVLAALGAPTTGSSLTVLNTMAAGESSGYLTGVGNPLATTRGGAGAYNLPGSAFPSGVNSAGVKGFQTQSQGVAATAATLRQSNFSALLANLRKGAPTSAYTTGTAAAELRTWQGGSSRDVNLLRGGGTVTTGQTSGASKSGQSGGGSSAQSGGFNPFGWLGQAIALPGKALVGGVAAVGSPTAPDTAANWLGTLVGGAVGSTAGAVAAGTVSGASGAAIGSAEGFYATAKPYVVPIGVSLVLAIIITPKLLGKKGNPVSVAINEIVPSSGSGSSDSQDQPSTSTEPAPAPDPVTADDSEDAETPAQVIQRMVGQGATSNKPIMAELNRKRANGSLIEDAGEDAAIAA